MNRTDPRTIPVLLSLATLLPVGILGWLGVRVIQQDRDLEIQRARDNLSLAAGRLALALGRKLDEVGEPLSQGRGVRFLSERYDATDEVDLLYGPETPRQLTPPRPLASAEELEYLTKDLGAAGQEYRRFAESNSSVMRAAALVGLGRILRKQSNGPAALQAYARLQELGLTMVYGQPAELLARQARCRLWEEANDRAALQNEARDLSRTLYAGGWRIDRSTFQMYVDMLQSWGAPRPPLDSIGRTEAALVLWRMWRNGDLPARGRRLLRTSGIPVLAMWEGGPARPVAWLAAPSNLEAVLQPVWKSQHLAVGLADLDGQSVLGETSPGAISLTPGETHLPFLLTVASGSGFANSYGYRTRRMVLVSALLLAFGLMLAAAFGLQRATRREMALVRQQSDFVSAVSHEFRTPLTSMRHLTDLLASRAAVVEDRKQQYYEILARETERLHHLVEDLLSLGRIQAGAYAWRLESSDAGRLVHEVVEEFRRDAHFEHRDIHCETETNLPSIQADRAALSHAVANLLDNAGKYSAPGSPIRVLARHAGDSVQISVEDRGDGIPHHEQKKLFERFVRGTQARRQGIRGIGIGLALVKSIAEAHGGTVTLASEPGIGSTFTLIIPCHES